MSAAEYLDATREVYLYFVDACDRGKHDISIPAMLVPAVMGMEYDTPVARRHFNERQLKGLGIEGVDWRFFSKKEVFSRFPASTTDVEFPVPGKPGEKIVMRRDAGNAAKFPFVTPHFALRLIRMSPSNIGQCLGSLFMEKDEFSRRLLPEKVNAIGVDTAVSQVEQYFVPAPEIDSQHDIVRDIVARAWSGRTEVVNSAGIADVETAGEVVEVKHFSQWAHGAGQALGYAHATGKSPVLVLFGGCIADITKSFCKAHQIRLVEWEAGNP